MRKAAEIKDTAGSVIQLEIGVPIDCTEGAAAVAGRAEAVN